MTLSIVCVSDWDSDGLYVVTAYPWPPSDSNPEVSKMVLSTEEKTAFLAAITAYLHGNNHERGVVKVPKVSEAIFHHCSNTTWQIFTPHVSCVAHRTV